MAPPENHRRARYKPTHTHPPAPPMLVQADGVVRPRPTLPPLENPAGSLFELVGGLPLDGRVVIE